MTSKREIRRAIHEAEDEIWRVLPSDLGSWMHRAIEKDDDYNTRGLLLAGALAGIGIELDRAFKISGSLVRDEILYLHRVLNSDWGRTDAADGAPGGFPALEASVRHLELFVKLKSADASEVRRAVYGWIEIASQRLTMDRYPRADERVRHARALIVTPAKAAGIEISDFDAEWVLRLWDLLGAEAAACRGQNLVSPAGGEMGGFYAIADTGSPMTDEELDQALEALRADGQQIGKNLGEDQAYQTELFDMILWKIGERIESGKWPGDFARGPVRPAPPRSIWRRLIG